MVSSNLAHAATVKPRPTDLELVALNGMFDEKDGLSVLRHALNEDISPNSIAMVSSFGADSSVLLHMVAQINPHQEVLFLETGKHFAETLEYVEMMKKHLGLTNVRFLEPDTKDVERFDAKGDLWQTDPDSCCHIRKTEPLDAALKNYGGWVTGRKRFQTNDRGVLPHFELTTDDRIKVNPLAYWDNDDVKAYREAHDLPAHPLFLKGYLSIGCAPCTSMVKDGEDPRSGRWRGKDKTECGIHFDVSGKIANPGAELEQSQMNLFKDGAFIADNWRDLQEDEALNDLHHVHIPLSVYVDNKSEVDAQQGAVGILLQAGDDVDALGENAKRFASIVVEFPAFTDGRGYSYARLLRERYDYTGELRARGDILTDQVPYFQRCGFDALTVGNAATRKALEENDLGEVSIFMQPIGASAEVPVGTRPFLRRAK
ncbi:phosphoadenylyl-sulfate reductase [Maritalea sp.]|uniref:phosphoadenylyl-sulfate reductase n=1 Tax=Maritalea sp. TaxID=2003361 RepID=UPI003EF9F957